MHSSLSQNFAICRIFINFMLVKQVREFLNDMAKVAIKYDNIVPYGGIFYAMNEFDIPNGGKGALYAHIS